MTTVPPPPPDDERCTSMWCLFDPPIRCDCTDTPAGHTFGGQQHHRAYDTETDRWIEWDISPLDRMLWGDFTLGPPQGEHQP